MDQSSGKQEREILIRNNINLGLASNIVLAILKITVGIVGHSRALLADGINSTSDVAYYIVVKVFSRLALKPADREHPYGHHQMESISAVVIGAFVITTAIAIFWDSINTAYEIFTSQQRVEYSIQLFTLVTAGFTILVKMILFIYTKRVARKTGSAAISALSHDHRNDILASTGAAFGIMLGWAGVPWGDPLAGAVVALIVLRTGIEILRESSEELMDTVPGDALEKKINAIVTPIIGVRQIEEMSAHRFGPYLVINLTVGIDGELSVTKGDAIATEIENRIDREIELVRRVYVHYHPAK